ncbi:hypothetical protein Tco_1061267 [Tanacetum coccineum]
MIKEHDQQAKIKVTPRRLAYADSDKEAPARSLARGFSNRFSLESSGTSDTHRQTRSASKSQRTPSKNKEPTYLRRSRRLEDWSITKEKTRRKRSKSRGKNSRYQETSSDYEYEEGSEDTKRDTAYQRQVFTRKRVFTIPNTAYPSSAIRHQRIRRIHQLDTTYRPFHSEQRIDLTV